VRLPNGSSDIWSISRSFVANGWGFFHNVRARGCEHWPWQGTTSTRTDETARSNDASRLKTSIKKKGLPEVQPFATLARVGILLSCDHWESSRLEIPKTCWISTARRPPAKFDGQVPNYVLRDCIIKNICVPLCYTISKSFFSKIKFWWNLKEQIMKTPWGITYEFWGSKHLKESQKNQMLNFIIKK